MTNRFLNNKIGKKLSAGFTLVELLIVIAILGVLAAAVIAILDPVDKIASGNDAKVVSDVNQIYSAVGRYIANNGTVPTTAQITTGNLKELQSLPSAPSGYNAYVNTPTTTDWTVCGQVKSKVYAAKAIAAGTACAAAGGNSCFFVASNGKTCWSNAAACPASCP